MFSPAGGRSRARVKDGASAAAARGRTTPLPSSPSTPTQLHHHPSHHLASPGMTMSHSPSPSIRRVPNTAIRSPSALKSLEKSRTDNSQPVFVSDFPQQLRAAQSEEIAHLRPGHSQACGGMDQNTGLSWMIKGTHMFVWSHVSSQSLENFRILPIPQQLCKANPDSIDAKHGDSWAVCIIRVPNETQVGSIKFIEKCICASVIICSRKSLAVVYWPDIFLEAGSAPIVSLMPEEGIESSTGVGRKPSSSWSGATAASHVSSMVAALYSSADLHSCVAIACHLTGELWRIDCSGNSIVRHKVHREVDGRTSQGELGQRYYTANNSGARSVAWQHKEGFSNFGWRQLLLLTASGLECWDVELAGGHQTQLLWAFDVLADLDNGKMLVGQKQVWLLDFQLDTPSKRLKLLLASYFIDKGNASSYMQYFTAIYTCLPNSARREGGIQVVLPNARIEEEDFLLSMRLRVGGKPEGSVLILASDGTATVAHSRGGPVRLYQFDLAWDAGRVIDACVLSSSDESEEGLWVVLTEKAGVWAIPGKAVLLCGVEPPERSLSRKGNQNDGSGKEDRWHTTSEYNAISRRRSLDRNEHGQRNENQEAWDQSQNDVEVEALIGNFFDEYVATGKIDGVMDKLEQAGAFEKEGEANVFALASKALVDSLAKHWTAGMVTNASMQAAVSSQLAEKQRRHQQFLHFLSASNCHEELQDSRRSALQIIMEHGEKLSAVIWLRELHNKSAQVRLLSSSDFTKSSVADSAELGGAVWELVLLAGEKARRSNAMLLDRDKAEIFYSRVSNLEDLFLCINLHIDIIVNKDQLTPTQVEKTCEISYACSKALQTAIGYRDSQQAWYPSPEGLTPWYCKSIVRSGLWKLATLILELKEEVSILIPSLIATLMSHLEKLADVLLEAYAGSITAMVEREEEYRGLQMEYWSRRDILLSNMHQYAKGLIEIAAGDTDDVAGEHNKLGVLRQLYAPVVSLARRHAGYQTLWDICTELKDMNSLRNLMHESMGLREGKFSNFVFEQCHQSKQFSKLLRLGEEFKDDLLYFLQNHKDLLWLHELYMQQFTLASSTVHWLALSREPAVYATMESIQGNLRASCNMGKLKIHHRKRLLNLAKLSALAGGEEATSEKIIDIHADIEMMGIQEEAYQLNMVEGDDVLTPRQLVELCLKSENRHLLLKTFQAFAWGGDLFRRSNKSLLEAAWLKAADQDDWIMMRQVSERDGWSDEQLVEALQNTVLYQAAKCCYNEESSQKGSSFQQGLPLFHKEAEEIENFASGLGIESVETILMQHRDFPEAGQAMLAAIRMGKYTNVYKKDLGDEMGT